MSPRRHDSPRSLTVPTMLLAAALAAAPATAAAAPQPGDGVIAFTQGSTPHIWLMDVDSGALQRLTGGTRADETPAWAPDGRRLVFADTRRVRVPGLADPQITPLIATLDTEAGTVRALTNGAGFDEDPAWSGDGRRIAFSRAAWSGGQPELWTMRTSGRGLKRVTRNSVADMGPAWSPDGRTIAFGRLRARTSDSWDVWSMRADGTGQRRLVKAGTRPAWSPDGTRIAYGRPKRSATTSTCCERDLYVMDANGANRRRLAIDGTRPTWSPDGNRIVFQRLTDAGNDLWVINADGTGARRLTSAKGDEWAPAWRPHITP